MSEEMAVSIILCSQNRADDLHKTLGSIARLHVPANMPAELIVVDNASTDHTSRVLAEAHFDHMEYRPLYEPKPGKSRGINMAIRRSRGAVVMFTDDDVRLPEDWIERMCRPILEGRADGVMGAVKLAPHLERPWLTGMKRAWLALTDEYDDTSTVMIGANMAVARHVFDQIPGLDTELGPGAFVAGDDVLFSWQFQEAGFRVHRELGVVIEHHLHDHRLTRAAFLKRAVLEGRQEAYLFHHWLHGQTRWSTLKRWTRRAQLSAVRLAKWGALRHEKGSPDWELRLLMAIGFHDQYRHERRRPRNYTRRGLKKLGAGHAQPIQNSTAVLETP